MLRPSARHRRQVQEDQENSISGQLESLLALALALCTVHAGAAIKWRPRHQLGLDMAEPAELPPPQMAFAGPDAL